MKCPLLSSVMHCSVIRMQYGVAKWESIMKNLRDNHAMMNVDTEKKTLNMFHPTAESRELAIPSELLLNTINFVNEHGGWTDEFRYTYMDPRHEL